MATLHQINERRAQGKSPCDTAKKYANMTMAIKDLDRVRQQCIDCCRCGLLALVNRHYPFIVEGSPAGGPTAQRLAVQDPRIMAAVMNYVRGRYPSILLLEETERRVVM